MSKPWYFNWKSILCIYIWKLQWYHAHRQCHLMSLKCRRSEKKHQTESEPARPFSQNHIIIFSLDQTPPVIIIEPLNQNVPLFWDRKFSWNVLLMALNWEWYNNKPISMRLSVFPLKIAIKRNQRSEWNLDDTRAFERKFHWTLYHACHHFKWWEQELSARCLSSWWAQLAVWSISFAFVYWNHLLSLKINWITIFLEFQLGVNWI